MEDLGLASHAVVFRGLVLPPPYTSPLKTTAWEANLGLTRVQYSIL